MTAGDSDAPLWTPSPERVAGANLTAFIDALHAAEAPGAREIDDYASLWRWSVERPEDFWPAIWHFCGVIAEGRNAERRAPTADGRGLRAEGPPLRAEGPQCWSSVLLGGTRMAPPDPKLGPRWFTGARLNFAENLLRYDDDRTALLAWRSRGARRVSYAELRREVARVAAALRASGVGVGDRVAGFLPNIPETVVAMLATTSIGAIWSSCSPDFGVKGVIDRFGQIEPKVLVVADGYKYSGKELDCLGRVQEIVERLPGVARVVVVPYLREAPDVTALRDAVLWGDFGEPTAAAPRFERLPFDHPAFIMYSSGTTGLPKCMLHSAGGTLIQHLKEHVLHCDLRRDDVIFYYTTCGWMMWNWLVSALAVGATVVLYDGAPLTPSRTVLWDMAAQERVSVFGASAKYLAMAQKEGVRPRATHDLGALRAILSTGSPLAEHSYDYVYRDVKTDVQLSSISGGTDIVSCFALGNPIGPVWRGEIQVRGLGMRVEVFDGSGRPVRGEQGELVCTMPFPSMPTAFWNDPDGEKYRAAYFERWPNVWRHGDWARLTVHDGLVITGRSDATLNPGGVRIGTAEIYRQVEQIPEVMESIVVGQEVRAGADVDTRVVLFVRLREGHVLDHDLRDRIRQRIREGTSPHHVPRKIVQVADIPRTISGKITELAVRDVIHGRPVQNVDALANPQALELFRDLPELRG